MGLPLFVAPVESDLPSKSADKITSSPSRSNIRRHGRPASRERRAAMRRNMSIRDRLNNGPPRPQGPMPSTLSELLDENEVGYIRRARPFREVLREMVRSDDRNRERFEEQLHSLFTGTPLRERGPGGNDLDDTVASSGFVSSSAPSTALEGYVRNLHAGVEPSRPRFRRRAPQPAQQSDDVSWTSRDRPRRSAPPRILPSFSNFERGAEQLAQVAGGRDVNGLGDRERSLSPEVWDTLLTTLTPDPQPPSAGSSFASTVASQNAGVSSGSALTTPEIGGAAAADQACESGCENSDGEDDDFTPEHFLRRISSRRVRVQVPDYNLDGPIDGPLDGPTDGPFSRRWDSSSEISRQARRLRNSIRVIENEPIVNAVRDRAMSISQLIGPRESLPPRSGWIGHLLVGTSDDEQALEPRRLNREGSTMSGNATSQGEEEWAGMQRIVRSLARREDIPDEWWAEAGLSRTLPQDGTD